MVGTSARSELSADLVGPDLVSGPGTRGAARTQGPALPANHDFALRFAIASSADDAAIRRLLRENPTRGAISVSFEREPSYFRREMREHGDEDQTIVAYEQGRLVCMGRCVVRPRYLNGELRRVGYLGELRLDASARRGVEILRGGYRFFREMQRNQPADLYFTSIAADNERARRVLERGLPGLPRYDFLSEFVTLLVPVSRAGRPLSTATPDAAGEFKAFLNTHAARHQLAGLWDADELAAMDDHVVIRDGSKIVAATALSDQRAWRQTVVRGYSRGTALTRPLVNVAASLFNTPRLPRVGAVVPAAFLSPLAIAPGQETRLPELIRAAFAPARARGVELLTLGFCANDPRRAIVRRHFRCREYRSRLYRVSWLENAPGSIAWDARPFLPEVALL